MAAEGTKSGGEGSDSTRHTSRSRAAGSDDKSAEKTRSGKSTGSTRSRSSGSRSSTAGTRGGPTVAEVAHEAAHQLAGLTGRTPEAVTAISRTDDGWQVDLDVVEIHRVPETADVIATYRAELDKDGQLVAYRRTARFVRSQTRED